MRKYRTYGDVPRAEIERAIADPEFMAMLERNYKKACDDLQTQVDADIARMIREDADARA